MRERWRFLPVEKLPTFEHRTPTRSWSAQRGVGATLAAEVFDLAKPPAHRLDLRTGREGRSFDMVEVKAADGVPLVDPLPDSLLQRSSWALVVKGAWKFPDSIHCKENRVALLSLRRCARSLHFHGKRVLTIGDNMSEIMACEKGRSEDPHLCNLLQRAMAYTLVQKVFRVRSQPIRLRFPVGPARRGSSRRT